MDTCCCRGIGSLRDSSSLLSFTVTIIDEMLGTGLSLLSSWVAVYLLSFVAFWLTSVVIEKLLYAYSKPFQQFVSLSEASTGKKKFAVEWTSRVVSDVHAIVTTIYSSWLLFVSPCDAWRDYYVAGFEGTRDGLWVCVAISAGYLTYDLMLILSYKAVIWDVLTVIHHSVAVVTFIAGLWSGFGLFYQVCFLFNEVSTPLVNLRWFHAVSGNKGRGYSVIVITGAVVFWLVRCCFNTYVLYHIVNCWRFQLPLYWTHSPMYAWVRPSDVCVLAFVTGMAFAHVFVNYLWGYLIFLAVLRQLKQKVS